MILIDLVSARTILNSRGEPTVETTITLSDGTTARASSPSGRSKSSHEAVELVDKDFANYFGLSVNHAVDNVNKIIGPRLKKIDPLEQARIDGILIELDGTPNKAHLGGNATLSVSLAVARVAALMKKQALYKHLNELYIRVAVNNRYEEEIKLPKERTEMRMPIPAFNLINGGQHADTKLPIQEYLIFPVGVEKMANKIRAAAEITHELKKILQNSSKSANIGDEGGFASDFDNVYEALETLVSAVEKTNYHVHNRVVYGFDMAGASVKEGVPADFYEKVFAKYPIISVEDPFKEEERDEFAALNKKYPEIFCTGDDIVSTNVDRLYTAIEKDAVDCVIVKPNQIGTVTETLRFAKVARDAGIELFVGHRSGETNDDFIADLAVGLGAKFIKAGAPVRGERVAKYNRLMEIATDFED